jgi:hypothetical protein
MEQGSAGRLAPVMRAELAHAHKLSGPHRREWPPAHDPVEKRDIKRYRELFNVALDTLRFQPAPVAEVPSRPALVT